MLACKHIHERLNEAHDGELSPLRRMLLRLHLWICSPCRNADCSMKATFKALRGLRDCPPFKADVTSPEKPTE
ncbi:MAG: zf-HC2 domain-containing protein [Sandaracinaceae bacterium]|nr:zf-HC2 domain-containing protein [Sandaracinaceae bacterium]